MRQSEGEMGRKARLTLDFLGLEQLTGRSLVLAIMVALVLGLVSALSQYFQIPLIF
jgi:hypothetical protein